MSSSLSLYSSDEFSREFADLIQEKTAPDSKTSQLHPKAMLLGGQSGAGKTTLHDILNREFSNNVIIINGDEYRSRHPRYKELDAAFGPEAVNHTASWAAAMTEALVDELSRMGYNLIIEGTLRTTEAPITSATLLRKRGYGVSLALMAVKPEISLISCQIRYEQMRLAGTIPRATDPAHHNKIVRAIVSNLEVLEQSGLFDSIRLFSRSREQLYPQGKDTRLASSALNDILFGGWTVEEKGHYAYLQGQLEQLGGMGPHE